MGMCKKQMLSFILTLALVVGCFAGTGITVKATDVGENVVVLATAVFEDAPVEGVEFELRDNSKPEDEEGYIVAKIISDAEGKLKYDIAKLNDATYTLYMTSSKDYDVTDTEYNYKVESKQITRAGDSMAPSLSVWTGNENFKFELEKKSAPIDPAKQSITIKLVDEPNGEVVTDPAIKLQVVDYLYEGEENPWTEDTALKNGEYPHQLFRLGVAHT